MVESVNKPRILLVSVWGLVRHRKYTYMGFGRIPQGDYPLRNSPDKFYDPYRTFLGCEDLSFASRLEISVYNSAEDWGTLGPLSQSYFRRNVSIFRPASGCGGLETKSHLARSISNLRFV
jgi:hypothetical protein